jgi:hypothetical protein
MAYELYPLLLGLRPRKSGNALLSIAMPFAAESSHPECPWNPIG